MDDRDWTESFVPPGDSRADAVSDPSLRRALAPLMAARRRNAPYVIGQLGQSLDGRIATETGHSQWINGAPALQHLHRLRALTQAVIVGAGTVRCDDPRLTVRHCAGENPARVVIDPRGTIGPDASVWADCGARRIVFGGSPSLSSGVERIPVRPGEVSPRIILDALAERGLRRVLIEGGADTLGRFLAAGAVDGLHLLIGPMIIGSGKPGISLPVIETLDGALRPQVHCHCFGSGDVLMACRFR